jgi:HD-GYP domain-containing protein (c-di-GMP phosphodiesterase class II)
LANNSRVTPAQPVVLADILSALSYALDLVEGQPMGHAVRTCLLAMEIGRRIGLGEDQLANLYFASLMKDAGCSSNSVRIHAIFGDDHAAKHAVKLIDWTRKSDCVLFGMKTTYPGQPPLKRLVKMIEAASDREASMDALTKARCNRGAQIALQLGFGQEVADAVMNLDEHWDGKGAARHLAGDEIPLLARILCLCQTLDVLALALGREGAYRVLRKRDGRWFDPSITKVAFTLEQDDAFWRDMDGGFRIAALRIASPAAVQTASESTVDEICDAFASIIDAKSSFTSEHSARVTRYSLDLGSMLGFGPIRMSMLKRSALLHDIGKLGVPTSILDKNGKLTEEEFATVRRHPADTERILSMISGFDRITQIAAAHHERLDGRGYHRGLDETGLDDEMRILAVADVFDALSAKRPYRDALEMAEVFRIMESEGGAALDLRLVGLLKDRYFESGVQSLAA